MLKAGIVFSLLLWVFPPSLFEMHKNCLCKKKRINTKYNKRSLRNHRFYLRPFCCKEKFAPVSSSVWGAGVLCGTFTDMEKSTKSSRCGRRTWEFRCCPLSGVLPRCPRNVLLPPPPQKSRLPGCLVSVEGLGHRSGPRGLLNPVSFL